MLPIHRETNFANMKSELESVNWNQALQDDCMEEIKNRFTAKLKSIVSKTTQYKTRRIDRCKVYIDGSFCYR